MRFTVVTIIPVVMVIIIDVFIIRCDIQSLVSHDLFSPSILSPLSVSCSLNAISISMSDFFEILSLLSSFRPSFPCPWSIIELYVSSKVKIPYHTRLSQRGSRAKVWSIFYFVSFSLIISAAGPPSIQGCWYSRKARVTAKPAVMHQKTLHEVLSTLLTVPRQFEADFPTREMLSYYLPLECAENDGGIGDPAAMAVDQVAKPQCFSKSPS